jgi:hypothetical protein
MQIVAPIDDALLDPIKRIAEAHRHELGFHTRASFVESVARKELLVTLLDRRPVGFTRFHHTRRQTTTLRELATAKAAAAVAHRAGLPDTGNPTCQP